MFFKGDDTPASFTDLSVDARATHTLEALDVMHADFEAVIRYNTQELKRFWLSPFKRKPYCDEISHAPFMLRDIAHQREHLRRTRAPLHPTARQGG